jgi:excisionase family DNA binding protein
MPPDTPAAAPSAEFAAMHAALALIGRRVDELVEHARGKAKPLLTVEEVAAEVGRSNYTCRSWIKSGKLKATRVQGTGPRGRLLVRREDLDRLLDGGR